MIFTFCYFRFTVFNKKYLKYSKNLCIYKRVKSLEHAIFVNKHILTKVHT